MSSSCTPRLALALFTLVGTSAAGCAILVGDVQGTLSTGDDAGHHDATKDQSAPRDSTSAVDAKKDDATSDARAPRDVGTSDVRVSHDASMLDAHDAELDAGHDGGHDAAPPGFFCDNLVVPDGSTSYCDDFDENANLSAAFEGLGQVLVVGPHALVKVGSDASFSPPNAMFVTTDAIDGGPEQAYLYLDYPKTGTTYTLDFDFLVTDLAKGSGMSEIGALSFGPSDSVAISVANNGDAGSYVFSVAENGTHYLPHNTGIGKAGWNHLTMAVGPVNGVLRDQATLNNVPFDNVALQPGFATTGATVGAVGFRYAVGGMLNQAWVDNVVFSVR